MIENVETALQERIATLLRIREAFQAAFPCEPRSIRRGPVQLQLLEQVSLPKTGVMKRTVNEALRSLGYRTVKVCGYLYFRK